MALAEGKHEEGLEFIGQAMELKPSSFKLLRLRSMAYACLHKYPKSLADAEKLTRCSPRPRTGTTTKGSRSTRCRTTRARRTPSVMGSS